MNAHEALAAIAGPRARLHRRDRLEVPLMAEITWDDRIVISPCPDGTIILEAVDTGHVPAFRNWSDLYDFALFVAIKAYAQDRTR